MNATTKPVRIGILGTSWWADSMYLPALATHPHAEVVGLCGRDPGKAKARADKWNVAWATVDSDEFLDPNKLDAVIIATPTHTHEAFALTAIERGLHVLCEKPMATSLAAANKMTDAAARAGTITLMPFTYHYMPTNQFVKRLIDDGFVGLPYHLNLRYFTGFAREGGYLWQFDSELAGPGIIGDLGSHWLHLARWLLGEVTEVGCTSERFIDRANRPDGSDYERVSDSAVITLRFENGAYATLQMSAVCWEGTDFNQTHHLDLHGSDGTIYSLNDWSETQEVRGLKAGQPGPTKLMEIPDDIWGKARRGPVHDTYRDVFRTNHAMVGDWIEAIRNGVPVSPDFAEGARIHQLVDLAQRSAAANGVLLDARV